MDFRESILVVLVAHLSPAFCDPWTVACQVPLHVEFSRQENWHGWPFPSPGDLPESGIEPRSPTLQADSLPSEAPGSCYPIYFIVYGMTPS